MILEQLYLPCLAQASYFIADQDSGEAVVVDPRRDIDDYLGLAAQHGVEIRACLLTHFHADFVSGHLELRDACGAQIYLGEGASADYPFVSWSEAEPLELGKLRLQCLATPGHTPESISILVFDTGVSAERPRAVLTGDTLFLGDVGRPDLLGSVGRTAEEMAGMLYDSLRDKLMKLPPDTIVYPGHGAGSMCGKNLSTATSSTLGEQLQHNYALQPMSREQFVVAVTQDQPAPPQYFPHDAVYNKSEHPLLRDTAQAALVGLEPAAFLAAEAVGAQVLDTRTADDFAAGHLEGSTFIGLGGKFATWAGTVLDLGRPILIIADPGQESEAVMRLGRIGLDQVAGYLAGGMAALLDQVPDRTRSQVRVDGPGLATHLAARPQGALLDVRGPGEVAQGKIEGACCIPLPELRARAGELDPERELTIYCAGGYRSVIAASLLAQVGHRQLSDLRGGYNDWSKTCSVR